MKNVSFILVFLLGVAEMFEFETRNRWLNTFYHVTTFLVYELSICLSLKMLSAVYLDKIVPLFSWSIPLDIMLMTPLIVHMAMNDVNHLTLIYHSIHGVSVHQL